MPQRLNVSQVSRVCVFAFSVLLILFTLEHPFRAHAQNPSEWELIQTCSPGLTYPTVPRSQWAFEGVIFSSNQDGVRAIRTDVNTSYFVALEGQESFANAGAFSPDGRWFAYPVGDTDYGVNSSGSNAYGVDAIEVVSTDPAQTVLRLPWWNFSMGMSSESGVPTVAWLDNERIVFPGGRRVDGEFQSGIVNVFENSIDQWTHQPSVNELIGFSPDATRGFYAADVVSHTWDLYDLAQHQPIASLPNANLWSSLGWLHDSSSFFVEIRDPTYGISGQFVWFDRQGVPLETIPFLEFIASAAVAPQDNQIAVTANRHLYIVDLPSRQVRDLCFEMRSYYRAYPRLVWSPNGHELAFTYDGYPILLSIDTLAMQVLQYPTGEIIGWYAHAEE